MFQIGASLREARTRRGLTPADVHKAVRIRERYLTAIEEERWEMLPGDAYTKGFLRTYAEFLGLNGQLYIDEFNARVAQHEERLVPEAISGRGRTPSRILFRTIAAVLVVGAAVSGLVAWQKSGTAQQRPTIEAAAAAPVAVTKTPAAPKPKPVAVKRIPKPTFAVIRAARDRSWLSVRIGGPAGREIFRGTLDRGHALRYGLKQQLWLRMGRPLALDIRIGKTPITNLPNAASNLLLTRDGPEATR